MTVGTIERPRLYCSFCGKGQSEVRTLIAGPACQICDECVGLSVDIINEARAKDAAKLKAEAPKQTIVETMRGALGWTASGIEARSDGTRSGPAEGESPATEGRTP